MPDKPWKREERHAATLIGGKRYPANSGGKVDVQSSRFVVQVKHVRRMSLAELEGLAVAIATLGAKHGKVGVVVVKRRAGRGTATPRLVVMDQAGFEALRGHQHAADRGGRARIRLPVAQPPQTTIF